MQAGRDVLVQMREAGLDAKAAVEILYQMLHGHAGELSEFQEDQIKDIADVVYGHCVKSLRVWERDPDGFTKYAEND